MNHWDEANRDKKLYESLILILFFFLASIAYVFLTNEGTERYYQANYILSFICLLSALLIILRRKDFREILDNVKLFLDEPAKLDRAQTTDVLFFVKSFLTIISILFIIDFEFLNNGVIRIGAVAAVGAFRVLYFTIRSF